MDVTDLLRRLARRRRAVIAVAVVAIVAAGIAWLSAGTSQQSSAAVVIVPPQLGSAVVYENPLLNLDNNLAQLATVLSASLESSDVGNALQEQGATATYSISTVTGNDPSFAQLSPQLVFTVTGSDASLAQRTATALVAQARSQLSSLQAQANVPSTARATLVQVVPPTDGQSVGGGRLKSSGSVFLAILILGLLGVLLADELLRRRFAPPRPVEWSPPIERRITRRGARRAPVDPDAPPPVPRTR